MLSLTLRQIEYAAAVARHGGVSAAASHLNISQPALSVALAQLETQLGRPLFLRRPGGRMAPTAFGRGWLDAAEVQLAGIARLADPEALASVEIRLAVFEDLAATCLAPLLARVAREEALRISPRIMGFEALSRALRQGEADLALTWDLGLERDIARQSLLRVPPHAVLCPDHPLAARPSLSLADLAGEPLVLADQGLSIGHMRGLFARQGLAPEIAHRAATLELMRSYAANGLGVGLSYTNPAARLSQDGRPLVTRPIGDAGAESLVIAHIARAPLPEAAIRIIALLPGVLGSAVFPDRER
jgi:DNA-binding transcriptional LysR family regulator